MDRDREANTRCTWFTQIGYVPGVEEFLLVVKSLHNHPLPSNIPSSPPPPSNIPSSSPSNIPSRSQQSEATELDEILANLPADPGHRCRMLDYPLNYREAIRRHYLQNDLCQLRDHIMLRKFKWLGYSRSKNVVFYRYCYNFKCDFNQMSNTEIDVFTEKGFTNWKKGPQNLRVYERGVGILHNKTVQQARDLMAQKQHIETFVSKQIDKACINYRTLLNASLECTRWLLGQGLPFHGHDESFKSSNRGNYLELMQFLSKHNEQVRKVVFENAPKNLKNTSSDIKKDLVCACAIETIDAITKDMEGAFFFSLLVDGSRDSSTKEQMDVLQLTLIAVAKGIEGVAIFFNNASILVNTIGSSCKRRDAFREKQQEQIKKALDIGDLEIGRGLNQESSLMRPCDTRWNSHYGNIVSIIIMFEAVVEVLEWIKDNTNQDNFGEASRLILGITNKLSQVLQKKDQDIVNAMAFVELCMTHPYPGCAGQQLEDDETIKYDDVEKI
ncbi:unnamed protein product [Malus baccata var. baccata]